MCVLVDTVYHHTYQFIVQLITLLLHAPTRIYMYWALACYFT